MVLAALVALLTPSMAWAAGDGAPTPDWLRLGAAYINMAIYLTVLVKFGKGPVLAFFADRRSSLLGRMDAAAATRAKAEATLGELKTRLGKADAEHSALVEEFRQMGERERDRAIEAAKVQAGKIVRDAEVQAESLTRSAQEALQNELLDQAMRKAQQKLETQSSEAARRRWVQQAIQSLKPGAVQPQA
jgi:F0F1-type ATP synthase membrane subunit b/b'